MQQELLKGETLIKKDSISNAGDKMLIKFIKMPKAYLLSFEDIFRDTSMKENYIY